MTKIIKPVKKISGEIVMPGDKSISHRAVFLGALARGKTRVKGLLDCDDCNYTIRALKEMGIDIKASGEYTTIEGKGLKGLKRPGGAIDCGASGTSMRLLAGLVAGQDFDVTLKGDESLSARPMSRVIEPLKLMGVKIEGRGAGFPPLKIRGGKVNPISYNMPIPSAQVKSCILLAGLYADGKTVIKEAFKSRDHTERMLKYFGANVDAKGQDVSIKGGKELVARQLEIPGDISSASFFMAAAALLKGSRVRIANVGINPTRAGMIKVLSAMGANIRVVNEKDLFEPSGDIEVRGGATSGITITEEMIPGVIDELPVIFVVAALSKGKTVIKGAAELKVKETDRIRSMKENLGRMGVRIAVDGGDITIEGVPELKGASLKSFGDHRTCMAMTVAALAAKGESSIDDAECVNKSFPGFFKAVNVLIKGGV